MSVMRPWAKRPHHRSTLNRLWTACCAEPLERRTLLAFNPVGADSTVNPTTANQQGSPSISMDADGDYVVVWQSAQDGDGYGIFGQLFNAAGVAQGSEFQVNTFTEGNQVAPSVSMDPFGNFVVAWQSYGQEDDSLQTQGSFGYGIYAQRFDATGTPQGTEIWVDPENTIGAQIQPAVAMDGAGNFVIVYTSAQFEPFNDNVTAILARMYDGLGNPAPDLIHVNTYTPADQVEPAVARNANGDWVVTWSSNGQNASGFGVFGQRFSTFGAPVGTEFQVGEVSARPQRNSTVAMNDAGEIVVAWQSTNSSFVRHFDALNNPTTDDLIAAVWTAFTTNVQNTPEVKLDADGNFVVLWTGPNDGGPFKGVYGIKFSDDRTTTTGEFRVNSNTALNARSVAFDMNADGDIVVVWQGTDPLDPSNPDIFSRTFTNDAPTQTVSVSSNLATVAEGDVGQAVFTVSRGAATTGDLTVILGVTGTAAGGTLNDFTFTADPAAQLRTDYSTLLVTIPNGQSSITFTMVQTDDSLVEGPQTAIVTVNSSFSHLVASGGANTATVTITDNDVLGMIVTPVVLSITEGGSLGFTVVLTAQPESDLVVSITKQVGGDVDLTANVTSLTFTPANWETAQTVTVSSAQDADADIGQAIFVVSATGLTDQQVQAVEADDEAPPTATPGRPDLVPSSDTGQSTTDNRTNLDNSNVGKALTFSIPNTVVGATVVLFADGVQVGSAIASSTTTQITTTGVRDLTDGNHVFTARQTELGKVTSTSSQGLTITVDTVAPVLTISRATGQPETTNTLPIRFNLLVSDTVFDLTSDKIQLSGTANAQTVLVTGSDRTFTALVSGISQSGSVAINMAANAIHDVAGNAVGAAIIIENTVTYQLNQQLPPNGLPFASLAAGKLTVNGTDIDTFPDVIEVLADGSDIVAVVNGNGFRFASSNVTSIEVYAYAGNDRVTIGSDVMGTYVLGGNGNDTLTGGDGNDSLTGASGKDNLIGNGGNDRVAGGKHNDRLFAGDGDDRVYGDEANDYMDGGLDRDRMYGSDGSDTMLGGNHNDTMYGEAGNDSMDGGNHNDRLYPGAGRDTSRGGNGNDNTFAADGAVDRIFGDLGNDGAETDPDDILDSIEFEI